jgi:hypothetical protein
MPERLVWTAAQDAQIKRLRGEGATWDAIAAALSLSRFTVIERGRRIGAKQPPPESTRPTEDPDRPALPPGHPLSWGAIIAGSCIAGNAYTPPVS